MTWRVAHNTAWKHHTLAVVQSVSTAACCWCWTCACGSGVRCGLFMHCTANTGQPTAVATVLVAGHHFEGTHLKNMCTTHSRLHAAAWPSMCPSSYPAKDPTAALLPLLHMRAVGAARQQHGWAAVGPAACSGWHASSSGRGQCHRWTAVAAAGSCAGAAGQVSLVQLSVYVANKHCLASSPSVESGSCVCCWGGGVAVSGGQMPVFCCYAVTTLHAAPQCKAHSNTTTAQAPT